jgi:hypothetical protein
MKIIKACRLFQGRQQREEAPSLGVFQQMAGKRRKIKGDLLLRRLRWMLFLLLSILYAWVMPDVSYSEPLRFGLFKYELSSPGGEGRISPFTENVPLVGTMGIKLVRHPLNWECFEPQRGVFDTKGCSQIKHIDKLISGRIEVQPTIRTAILKESNHDLFWATGKSPTSGHKIPSRPPLDLTSDWSAKYGYSRSYYEFISALLSHFCTGSKCSISEIGIENEANSTNYWISTGDPVRDVEDYIKLVKTAKKAVVDKKLPVKVIDSGVQGWTLPLLAMDEAAKRGDLELAGRIDSSLQGKPSIKEALKKMLTNRMKAPEVVKADLMLKSDLYKTVDAVNFHHYQTIESLPYIVDFLRKSVPPGKQLVCNEVGIKGRFLKNNEKAMLPDLIVKKALTLFSLGVNPVIWFSLETQDNVAHMVSNSGIMSVENSRAVQKVGRLMEGASAVRPFTCSSGGGFVVAKTSGETKVCFDASN